MPQLVLTELVDDNSLRSNAATSNYGTNATTFSGYYASGVWRAVMRFGLDDLPSAAVVTSALLSVTQYGRAESTKAGTAQLHRIKDANAWTDAGSCWSYTKNTTPWAGAAGCATPDVDYVADASPPTLTFDALASGEAVLNVAIPIAWINAWRVTNQGFRIANTDEADSGKCLFLRSRAAFLNANVLTIDYVLPASMPWLAARRL